MKKLFLLLVCFATLLALGACQQPEPQPGEPPHTHTLSYFEQEDPSCTEEGRRAFWECDECGELFADEEGSTSVAQEELVISAPGHKDENEDLACDGCGKFMFAVDDLRAAIDATLSLSHATVSEYYFVSNMQVYYAIEDGVIRITGDREEVIDGESTDGALCVGYVFADRFDLSIASEITQDQCFVGTFADRQTLLFVNESGTKVACLLGEDAATLDGILIYDEYGNILYEFVITA